MKALRVVPTEHSVQQAIMQLCQRNGVTLFRNNRGRRGYVIFGLCAGASDLIGWKREGLDGCTVARFVAIEVKRPGWKPPSGPGRSEMSRKRWKDHCAQRDFIARVRESGGDAGFARCVEDAERILNLR